MKEKAKRGVREARKTDRQKGLERNREEEKKTEGKRQRGREKEREREERERERAAVGGARREKGERGEAEPVLSPAIIP